MKNIFLVWKQQKTKLMKKDPMYHNLLKCVSPLAICMLAAIPIFTAKADASEADKVKYVRFEKSSAVISLGEVQVFSAGKNIAPTGKAAQSSTYDVNESPASKAIDGNTDGRWGGGSVTHTAENGDDNPWWELTLPNPAVIDEIVVWNRADSNQERLNGVKMILLDEAHKPIAQTVIQLSDPAKPDLYFKMESGELKVVIK